MPALPAGALAMRWPIYRFHRHQGSTNDCGPFCVAIAVNALKGKSLLNGSGVARQMERCRPCAGSLPLPVLDKIPGWATLPWGLSDELRRHGVPSRWRFMGTRERLLSNLRTDRITLISVGEPLRFDRGRWRGWGHVKILYAWAPGHGWAFVDPALPLRADAPWQSHGIGWQSEEGFARQWTWMLRFMIELRL